MTDKIERSIRARRSDAPEWLDALIARALAMNPADRFADARELLVALRASRGPAQVKARVSRAPILIALAILVAGGVVATVVLTRPTETESQMASAIDAMAADAIAIDATPIDATVIDAPPRDASRPAVDAASTKTAEELNAEGKELMYAARFAEAAAVYEQLVRVAPIAKYYFNLCTALYSNGEYDAATQACKTGLAKHPDAALKEKLEKLLERIAGSR
jgi:tetratricopeptide (TPR) repeat protein